MSTVDLYRLVIGDRVWTMASGERDVPYNDELYRATPIGRGGVQSKSELSKSNLEVRLPLSHEVSVLLLTSWLEQIITITVFRHRSTGTMTIWKGRLASIPPDDDHLKLNFESIFTSMRRPGIRARYQKSCRHALYGRGCRLDHEDFASAGTVTDITGTTVTVTEAGLQADGYFTGGMIKSPDGTLSYIMGHSGELLEVSRVSANLALEYATSGPGVAVSLYPGCDHSYATCLSKFSNDLNYGGFDYIPTKNPMGGSSIV